MAGARSQRLFSGPQAVAAPGCPHYGQAGEIDTGGGERGRIRQVRRREPDHALARGGQRSERRQQQPQLADPLLQAEDLGEPAGRPAAPRQLAVQDRKPAGDGGSTRRGCSAAPDGMPLEDIFESHHEDCIFIQYYCRWQEGYDDFQGGAMAKFTLRVNGAQKTLSVDADTPLLYVLRNDVGLNGPKFGCGLAQCGACTVLVGGKPVRSCVTPMSAVKEPVTTIEGLGTLDKLHPLQRAFIEEQACQCGYCGNGMVMSAKALNGHLCRCASHNRIVRAVQRAAKEMRS